MSRNEIAAKEAELTDHVSEHYRKFFNKFAEINSVDIKEWKPVHLIAYLCRRYEEYYKVKYSFKFNDPAPSKSYEVYIIKKLANMLTSDPQMLKQYIDWVFDQKVIEKKKRITSLALFSHQDIVNEFKFKYLSSKPYQVSRNDNLPQEVISICAAKGFDITTYAELAFIKKMPNQSQLFDDLKSVKFNTDILDKIA